METAYNQSGNSFTLIPKVALLDNLPVGVYTVKKDPMMGSLYLARIEEFDLPTERYGDNDKMARRVINTFKLRNKQTGIMLTGEKGSGKSLLAQTISTFARQEEQVPTIVINEPWAGEAFNMFIQAIKQPCVVIFDEFEKVYDEEHQEAVLTLLDGTYPTNKLYIFTANNKYRLNNHMRNRPGRIFYALDFKGLTPAFIRMYCDKNLEDKTMTESVLRVATMFSDFNFDMLKALIEEMNRYKETPQEAVKILNIKPEFDNPSTYDIAVTIPNGTVKRLYREKWKGNPLTTEEIEVSYYKHLSNKEKDDGEEEYKVAEFAPNNLKRIDTDEGSFEFENADGVVLQLTREKVRVISAFDHI